MCRREKEKKKHRIAFEFRWQPLCYLVQNAPTYTADSIHTRPTHEPPSVNRYTPKVVYFLGNACEKTAVGCALQVMVGPSRTQVSSQNLSQI